MTVHAANCWALLAYCVISAWVFSRADHEAAPPQRADPMLVVPADTPFLVTLELKRLRSSELGRAFATQLGAQATRGLSAKCETVLGRAERLVVVLPRLESAGDLGAIALASAGPFESAELARCVGDTLAAKGLKLTRESRSGFELFSAGSSEQAGVVALRPDGLLLSAGRPQLDGMLAAATHAAPNIRSSKPHRLLRELVGVNGTLLVSWFAEGSLSLFPDVRAAALRADFSPDLHVDGVVRCAGELACAELATSLRGLPRQLLTWGLQVPDAALTIREQPELLRFSLDLSSELALQLLSGLRAIPLPQ